jgi:RNA polymerase sigma-70 factor, ECF subfamily
VPSTDRGLLGRAARGDADALTALLNRHGPAVRRRLVINPLWQAVLDPADVMQVTYLEAFLRIHQLEARDGEGFRAWLDRLAQNNLRDAIRELEAQKRPDPRRQVVRGPENDSAATLLETLSDGGPTASHIAASRESKQALEDALCRLPPMYAQVVRLHDLDGQSVGGVGMAMDRSPGSVCMLRARALDRLRELLGPASRYLTRRA